MTGREGNPQGARVRFPPPLVFLVFLALGSAAEAVHPWPVTLAAPALPLLVAIVGGAGLALLAWTLGLFFASGQDPEPWKPTPTLIFRGPYRFSRNPMYLAMVLLHVAAGLGLRSLWLVLGAAPALLLVHVLAVRPEERYLQERFGDAYRAYTARVRRYL